MSNRLWRTRSVFGAALCVAALLEALVFLDSARAQQPTSEDILKALMPKTRDFRGVAVEPGSENKPPSIDLYINFKFDSSELEPDALLSLKALGQALRSPELKDARIQIVGHTDAKGTDTYNNKLSERRASAVRSLLATIYEIDPARLQALGRGKSELKDKTRPEDGINRRVEIRNVTN
jgi:outer membrane protein OmpA-like peptidoglycan-associated protein